MRREYLDDHCHHDGGAHKLVPFYAELLEFSLEYGKALWNVYLLDQGIHQNEYYSCVQIHDHENFGHAGDQILSNRVIPFKFGNGAETKLLNRVCDSDCQCNYQRL